MKHDIKLSDEINRLIKKHRALDNEADNLSARKYLSQAERHKLKTLKVERLWVKDKITTLSKITEEAHEPD